MMIMTDKYHRNLQISQLLNCSLLGLYSNSVEMHDNTHDIKENRLSQDNQAIDSQKPKNPFERVATVSNQNNETDTDISLKSNTKLPPLKKIKADQISFNKTNQISTPLDKRMAETGQKMANSQNSYVVRKFNQKRKNEKKKTLQQLFKPEIITRYDQYMSFLNFVNISNNIRVHLTQFEQPYVLHVGKGNNGSLIKSIFRNYRPWWVLEQGNPTSSSINLHWYQLRQNWILEEFREYSGSEQEIQKIDYFVQQNQHEEKQTDDNEPVIQSRNQQRSNQRSQSLISKQPVPLSSKKLADLALQKRNSSRTKMFNKSTDKIFKQSPSTKQHSIKQLKEEVVIQSQQNANKKALANPKMWPIYSMYRRIFSGQDLKNIKKLKIIKEDGGIKGELLRSKMKTIENRSNIIKMHNHLENNWNLSNKKALFVNIRHYFEAKKINPFEYIPMTFHVEKIGDKEYDSFVQQYHRRTDQISQDQKNNKKSQYKAAFKPKKRNAWLVKPGQNTNRGVGIEVVESLEQIKQIITKDNMDLQGRPRTHIIQQYIMPFLYQKRKFDIRCYILITSVNGIQKGYWYQDGYIRTACKQFNMKNLANRMIHLTNDAVQKKCQDYGKFEPGNKLSFADFQRYLDTNYNNIENGPKFKFWQQAYPQMKKLATEAIKSVYTKINPHKKQFSFEVFGLDFLIDENFKVWLIQANTNPCLELSSPLLGRIIPSMLENAFKIAVDPVFPPPPLAQIAKLTKKLMMPQNPMENNKFQLVFDQVQQGQQLKALLNSAPEAPPIYNIQEEEQEYEDQDKENQNCFEV